MWVPPPNVATGSHYTTGEKGGWLAGWLTMVTSEAR